MRFLRQSLIGLVLASVTLGLLALAGQMIFSAVQERMTREPDAPQRRERVFAVNVVEARAGNITPVLTAFGEVKSRRTLEIRAKSAGTLIELSRDFVEGGRVSEGALLARVDPADANSDLARAASDVADSAAEMRDADRSLALARDELEAARAQAELRERALKRQRDLEERGVGTAASVETAELAAAAARQAVLVRRQSVASAEARVDQAATGFDRSEIVQAEAQRRVDDTRIIAGFTGQLSDVSVVEGGLVSPNERLADLVDAQSLEVAFRVSTPQYARLLDPQGALVPATVTVTLEAFGVDLTATGKVSRASAAVGEGQTGRLVFAQLDPAPGLKPGDFVTVTIDEPQLNGVFRLPATALAADGTVLVVGDEDRLQAIEVTLLRRQGDDVLVAAEVLEGQRVVSQRSPLLGAGIKVRPLTPGAGGAASQGTTVALTDARRAQLVALVKSNSEMPQTIKDKLLQELDQDQVPAHVVQRLENRTGG